MCRKKYNSSYSRRHRKAFISIQSQFILWSDIMSEDLFFSRAFIDYILYIDDLTKVNSLMDVDNKRD